MSHLQIKKYNTIGCCGIDCGLCPRFYTKGDSICPGCCGKNFKDKHPPCGVISCCVIKNKLEVCGLCKEYPCKRFDSEKEGYDSFVTHKNVFVNLNYIKNYGIDSFMKNQQKRIEILKSFLSNFDDGRSKNVFCLACALLPIEKLNDAVEYINNQVNNFSDLKEKNKVLKDKLFQLAKESNIELKLFTKNN